MHLRGNMRLLLGQLSHSTFMRLSVLLYHLFKPICALSHPSIWVAIVSLSCKHERHLKVSLQARSQQWGISNNLQEDLVNTLANLKWPT